MKGQMEIAGLVIIVILITLGLLFLTQFALREQPTEKIPVKQELLAQSTMGALLKTTISESCVQNYLGQQAPQLGKDILEDCAKNYDTVPLGFSQYRCNRLHSCEFARAKMEGLLNATLQHWGLKYQLNVSLVSDGGVVKLFSVEKVGCPGTRVSSGDFPLSTEVGTIHSVLWVC